MTGPYGFWWTVSVVILCLAVWQTGRAIFRHGQSQPDQARHPSRPGIEDLAAATGALQCPACLWWLDDEEHGCELRFTPCPDHDPEMRTAL